MITEPYPLDDFELEIVDMDVTDMDVLVSAMLLSARLAALGRPTQLNLLVDHAMKHRNAFNGALQTRCKNLAHELRNTLKDVLGNTIITCNDAHCLLELAPKGLLYEMSRKCLKSVVNDSYMYPDADAVQCLEDFLVRFPLPEDMRTPTVDSPITEAEIDLLNQATTQALNEERGEKGRALKDE